MIFVHQAIIVQQEVSHQYCVQPAETRRPQDWVQWKNVHHAVEDITVHCKEPYLRQENVQQDTIVQQVLHLQVTRYCVQSVHIVQKEVQNQLNVLREPSKTTVARQPVRLVQQAAIVYSIHQSQSYVQPVVIVQQELIMPTSSYVLMARTVM